MQRYLFIGIFIIGLVLADIPNFCNENGCSYPPGWDVCMICTNSTSCNGQTCVVPSNGTFLYNECSYITATVCSCPISLVNAGCAYGDGCCRSRLSYKTFNILNGALGWVAAGTFYAGKYLESIFHIVIIVVGAVIVFIIFMNSVNPADKQNTRQPIPRPDCSRPFRWFWIVLAIYLLIAIGWWVIDVGLYTNQTIYDNYGIELY